MTEDVLNSNRIAMFAIEEAKKGNPIELDVSNMPLTNLSYIRKIINSHLYNGKIFDESNNKYIEILLRGKFHPQIPKKLISINTCLKYDDGTTRS